MIVILKVALAGADFTLRPGDLYDAPDEQAQSLIDAGFAEPLSTPVEPEEIDDGA